jgi:hypothetical protein
MYDLDGNAIAASLFDLFVSDMTTAVGTCRGCGWAGPLAEVAVYLVVPGVVARCPRCDQLLMVIVQRRGMACVDLGGFSSMEEEGLPVRRPRPLRLVRPTASDPGRTS